MNKIKGVTFYRNYFEIIKYLKDDERLKLYDAISEYIFEDKEPVFDGLILGIWNNLKMPLNTSKNNAKRSLKSNQKETGEKPKENRSETKTKPKENRSETKTKPKENRSETNNISTFLFLISNFLFLKDKDILRNKIEEWIKYKCERKEYYKDTGFKSLLTQIQNNVEKYGEQEVTNLINECMASNYAGIIFDKLKDKKKITSNNTNTSTFTNSNENSNLNTDEQILKRFDENQEIIPVDEDERNELEELLKEFR